MEGELIEEVQRVDLRAFRTVERNSSCVASAPPTSSRTSAVMDCDPADATVGAGDEHALAENEAGNLERA